MSNQKSTQIEYTGDPSDISTDGKIILTMSN